MTISISLDLETWGTKPGCDIRSIGACVFDPAKGWTPDPAVDLAMIDGRPVEPRFYIACDNPVVTPQYGAPDSMDSDRDFIRTWNKLGYNYGRDELENVHLGWEMKSATGYKYPLHRDPQTVQWWSEQSDEAQAAFADSVDLRDALVRFAQWLYSLSDTPYEDAPPLSGIRLWSHGAAFDPPILAAAYDAVGLPVPWHYRAPRDTRTLFDAAGIEDHSALLARHSGDDRVLHHALSDAICQARAVCAAYALLRDTRDIGDWVP